MPSAPRDDGAVRGGSEDNDRAGIFVATWWRITQALSNASTPAALIDTVVTESVTALGADAASVMLLSADGEHLEIRGATGYDSRRFEEWRLSPLDRRTPSTEAYHTRAPVLIETVPEAVEAYPALREVLAHTTGSLAVLPLIIQDQTLGVLSLFFHEERRFDPTDRSFLLTLASLCAQSLQRSAALAQAQLLNTRLRFLADASGILSRSLDLKTILDSVARLTIPEITDWCVIYLPMPDGRLEPATIAHLDPAMVEHLRDYIRRHPTHATPDIGVGRVYLTGQPELVATVTDEMYDALPLSEAERAELRHLSLRSVITVPMIAADRTVGVLGLGRTTPGRAYSPDDMDFAQQLANRAAKAVENARLHHVLQEELQQRRLMQDALDAANAHLEDRVRERTEELLQLNDELQAFAHSASHDLRTPIRHIVSFTDLLARRLPAEDERVQTVMAQVRQGAQRLSRTVDGLLTLSRASQQPLERQSVDLGRVTALSAELLKLEPSAQAVEWQIEPLPTVQGDPVLLDLVMHNLLSNAVKYSRQVPHPRVTVSAGRRDGATLITVSDNGVGFDPAYADKLFQPFQRLHTPGEFEGTGLGLANVRRIIARHGGQVWGASTPGEGATFAFTLPD